MVLRALLIIAANAIFLICVLWYLPVDGLLAARGYTPAQIAALKTVGPAAVATQPTTSASQEQTPAEQETAPPPAADNKTPQAPAAPPQAAQSKPAQTDAKTTPSPPPQAEPPPAPEQLVATDTINVRAGSSTDKPVLGQVDKGDVVTVLDDPGGDWVRIKRGDVTGWAYRPLFKTNADSP